MHEERHPSSRTSYYILADARLAPTSARACSSTATRSRCSTASATSAPSAWASRASTTTGTRHLSRFELRLDGPAAAAPQLDGASETTRADASTSRTPICRRRIRARAARHAARAARRSSCGTACCYERLAHRRTTAGARRPSLDLAFDADFARHLRGARHAAARARAAADAGRGGTAVDRLRYEGLDGVARRTRSAVRAARRLRVDRRRARFDARTSSRSSDEHLIVTCALRAPSGAPPAGRSSTMPRWPQATTAMRRRARAAAGVAPRNELFNDWLERSLRRPRT